MTTLTQTIQNTSMVDLLASFGGVQIENLYDESRMDLPWLKEKLNHLLKDNIKHTMNDDWDSRSKMNKLLIDNERSKTTIFTLRIGGRRITRFSFPMMDMRTRCSFLNQYLDELNKGSFDIILEEFLSKQLEESQKRKDETRKKRNEKNRQKRLEDRKQKEIEKGKMWAMVA